MNRSRARASSALALLVSLVCTSVGNARAATVGATAVASFWYAGTRLSFDHPQLRAGALSVGNDDSGLARFLGKLGATLAYRPAQNEIVVSRGDAKFLTFTVGDARYALDGSGRTAPFAPYVAGGVAYVPFLELAHALGVEAVDDGSTTVLEPRLAGPDVRTEGRSTVLTFRGASPLHYRRLSESGDDTVSIAFSGIGPALEATRAIAGPGVRAVSIVASGTPKNPTTVVNFVGVPGGAHALVASDSANSFAIAFGPAGAMLGGVPIPRDGASTVASLPIEQTPAPLSATPLPPTAAPVATEATPTAAGLPVAIVSDISAEDTGDGMRVHLKVAGDVTYEWHRLLDNRWYVDLKPATLAPTAQEVTLPNSSVDSLRVKAFVGPTDRLQTVRVAFTLASPRGLSIAPEGGGIALTVDAADDTTRVRVGLGEISDGKLVSSIVAPPTPAPDPAQSPTATWKFSPEPIPGGAGRLVVIDPGHGGSDTGAISKINGLVEKDLNLALSKSLRAALIARGWHVKLTRESDVDVYAPNDSAHDELQARDDIANSAGARLFISMHTNSFTSSSLNGTTTYYFNPSSYPLAQAIHARLAATLPTKDDGIRKENFYVIHHTPLPSVLIETAFLSNPGDATLLASPGFLAKIVSAIADGVGDYANLPTSVTRANATPATDDR